MSSPSDKRIPPTLSAPPLVDSEGYPVTDEGDLELGLGLRRPVPVTQDPVLATEEAERRPPAIRVGLSVVGRYEVEKALQAGGQGSAYLALDTKFDRLVVLKLSWAGTEGYSAQSEAAKLARVRHASIVGVYDVHEGLLFSDEGLVEAPKDELIEAPADPVDCLVLEYATGRSLSQLTRGNWEPIPIAEVLGLVEQLLSALEAVHKEGVAHLDVKPDNVRVDFKTCSLKLLDFGLAKTANSVTGAASHPRGTFGYLSPEHLRWKYSTKGDLWGAGVVLYEMLVWEHPFPGSNFLAVLDGARSPRLTAARMRGVSDNMTLGEAHLDAVQTLVDRSLTPEKHYAKAADFLADVRALRLAVSQTSSSSSLGSHAAGALISAPQKVVSTGAPVAAITVDTKREGAGSITVTGALVLAGVALVAALLASSESGAGGRTNDAEAPRGGSALLEDAAVESESADTGDEPQPTSAGAGAVTATPAQSHVDVTPPTEGEPDAAPIADTLGRDHLDSARPPPRTRWCRYTVSPPPGGVSAFVQIDGKPRALPYRGRVRLGAMTPRLVVRDSSGAHPNTYLEPAVCDAARISIAFTFR